MELPPTTEQIGKDEVTYFSMVSGPEQKTLDEAIGQIIIEFGRLEYLVKSAIEKIIRDNAVNRDGRSLGNVDFSIGMQEAEEQHTFSRYCDYLGALYERWQSDAEIASSFKYLVAHLKNIADERNAIVHSAWGKLDDGCFVRLRSRYDRKSKSLYQAAERFDAVDLNEFFSTVNFARHALAASIGYAIGHKLPIAAPVPPKKDSRSAVLLVDLLVQCDRLDVSRDILGKALGLDVTDLEDVVAGRRQLKEDQVGRATILALQFRKLLDHYRDDIEAAKAWLRTKHWLLKSPPLHAILTIEGVIAFSTIPIPE